MIEYQLLKIILFYKTRNKFNQPSKLLIFIVADRNLLYYTRIKELIAWYLFELLMINRNLLYYIKIKKLITWYLFGLLIINRNLFYYTWIKEFWDCYYLVLVWTAYNWLKFVLLYLDQEILRLLLLDSYLLFMNCL